MIVGLLLLRFVCPSVVSSRLLNVLIIALYTIIGALIYFVVTYKTGTINRIFGKEFIDKIVLKFKSNKK